MAGISGEQLDFDPGSATPHLSIITITLDDQDGLAATLSSVWSQTLPEAAIEHIVIDGVSSYDVRSLTERLGDRVLLVQESDDGIFDAMNKGLHISRGKYVLFLNSGDTLVHDGEFHKIISVLANNDFDLIYGDSLERQIDGTIIYKTARKHKWAALGMFTHHQAMIFKRALCADTRYNKQYRVAGDYDFVLRFCASARSFLHISAPLCLFECGGISQTMRVLGRREQFAIRRAHYKSVSFAAAVYCLQSLLMGVRERMPRLYWSIRNKRK